MPVFLLTLWPRIKPFLPYIGIALAVLAAWLLAVGHGKATQKAKDAKEIAAITHDRDTWKANTATLQAALDKQNAAVDALKAESDQKAKDGAKALLEAQKANQGLKDQAAALRKSAGKKYAPDAPCTTSDTALGVTI